MTGYRFIFDNDSRKAARFFPRRRIVFLEQAGLTEKASDRKIVEVASDRKWIIVTANGDDFVAEIKRYDIFCKARSSSAMISLAL